MHSFLEATASSVYLSLKPSDIQFVMIYNKEENQQIITYEKLEAENAGYYFFKKS